MGKNTIRVLERVPFSFPPPSMSKKSLVLKITGHTVNFKEYLSSKADNIFQEQFDRGMEIGTNDEGKAVVTKVKNVEMKKAFVVVFPYVVDSVYLKDSSDEYPRGDFKDFLDELPLADFNEIRSHIEKMKQEADKLLADSKK
jgi:hypothetical protein